MPASRLRPMPNRTIVVVDVAGFTRPDRTIIHQSAVHEGLYRVLPDAFAELGVDWDACVVEDRGDGMMILVPPEVSNSRLADQLPGRLVAGLRRHNAVSSPEAAMQLRVALHVGEVYQDGRGVVSQAVNVAFRILNAPDARSALRSSTGLLALLASETFYREVIVQDPATDPGSYRQISVPVSEGQVVAWLCLPDHQRLPDHAAMVAPEVRDAVVKALMEAQLAEDAQGCSLLTQAISDSLGRPLGVPPHLVGKEYLIELVEACAGTEGGTAALARAVWLMRPGSPEHDRISQLLDQPRVLELLPASELQCLREWLVQITIPQLRALVHQAAGPGVPPAPSVASAWEAFAHLAEFNAAPGGLPPALMFVELLAGQVTCGMRTDLTSWLNDQKRRLRLEPELGAPPPPGAPRIPVDTRLHLMIVLERDGIDPNRYLLSYWRQDDPAEWPPARGETRMVMVDELERRVDDLVVSAERAWSGHGGTVALEFVLPRALLNLPVHRWCKEHDSGDPYPLCLDYPIVVRSLERMQSLHWHRKWHQRWQILMNNPSAAQIYFEQPTDIEQRHRLDAILRDPRWALMVLTAPPPRQPQPGVDELGAALRSGLPALVWHSEASSEALRGVVDRLVEGGGLSDLPGLMQASRQDAFRTAAAPFDENIACDLVVLWDDPHRLVVLDQDYPNPGGDIDDEHKRAS
jgi:vWA-MoxR associated protein C-terminal domain/vWA-MoxR associated protein middle region 0/Effector-associated domain 2